MADVPRASSGRRWPSRSNSSAASQHAVLPVATRTEIWQRAGRDTSSLPAMMKVGELVDAALVGFDRREPIPIPPLPDAEQWDAYQAARKAMIPGFAPTRAATRYRKSG